MWLRSVWGQKCNIQWGYDFCTLPTPLRPQQLRCSSSFLCNLCPEMDTKAWYEVVHSLKLVPKIRTHRIQISFAIYCLRVFHRGITLPIEEIKITQTSMPIQTRFNFPITSNCEWYTMAYSFVRKFLTLLFSEYQYCTEHVTPKSDSGEWPKVISTVYYVIRIQVFLYLGLNDSFSLFSTMYKELHYPVTSQLLNKNEWNSRSWQHYYIFDDKKATLFSWISKVEVELWKIQPYINSSLNIYNKLDNILKSLRLNRQYPLLLVFIHGMHLAYTEVKQALQ
jgi:hypothetical protein